MTKIATTLSIVVGSLFTVGCQKAAADSPGPTTNVVIETGDCGAKGQKECPTQRWMKATVQSYQKAADWERLASALDELAHKEPQGFDGWKAIAEKGAAAAREKNDDGVRQSCRSCHDDHRENFRATLRKHVLFGS